MLLFAIFKASLAAFLSFLAAASLTALVMFFRIFDITKPSIIGKIDKKTKGGLGVMLDDMLAGLFAGLLSAVIYGFLLKFDLVFWDKDLINLF